MKEFHVTIMSEDPYDEEGIEQGDNHQKYGFNVQAKDEAEAKEKGIEMFKEQYDDLPIFWVKVFPI